MDTYYVTTAIDYANAAPHIGHAYEKIAADIVARYNRLLGKRVFFLTGTDEHGSKVEKAAAAAGKASPQEFVDEVAGKFQVAWSKLAISNDYFIRTTEARHKKVVQEVFRKMRDRGDIYKSTYTGMYCEGCEDFLRESDLTADGLCPNHRKAPRELAEENYFFRLTKYKDQVREWLNSEQATVLPVGRRQEVLNQLADPELKDFSITRSRGSLTWGIPVPDDPDHVIYVWIDALTNYITGAGYLTDDESWQRWWPANLHLIGKDITKFHAIYWPAMLLSIEVPLPKLVFGHGFITVEGQKMSKTLGNVLDPIWLCDTYGADAIRYFLFEHNTFDQDGDFSRKDLITTVNSHLANNFGNLLNRTLSLLERNFDSLVPECAGAAELLANADQSSRNYHDLMGQFEFAKAIHSAFEIVDAANRYLADSKPWALLKEGKRDEAGVVLTTCFILLKRATILLAPVIPNLASAVWTQLGFDSTVQAVTVGSPDYEHAIPKAQKVRNQGPVFKRIEEEVEV